MTSPWTPHYAQLPNHHYLGWNREFSKKTSA
jgi:hypothetical protein